MKKQFEAQICNILYLMWAHVYGFKEMIAKFGTTRARYIDYIPEKLHKTRKPMRKVLDRRTRITRVKDEQRRKSDARTRRAVQNLVRLDLMDIMQLFDIMIPQEESSQFEPDMDTVLDRLKEFIDDKKSFNEILAFPGGKRAIYDAIMYPQDRALMKRKFDDYKDEWLIHENKVLVPFDFYTKDGQHIKGAWGYKKKVTQKYEIDLMSYRDARAWCDKKAHDSGLYLRIAATDFFIIKKEGWQESFQDFRLLLRITRILDSIEITDKMMAKLAAPIKNRGEWCIKKNIELEEQPDTIPSAWMADKRQKKFAAKEQDRTKRTDQDRHDFDQDFNVSCPDYFSRVFVNTCRNQRIKDADDADDIMHIQLWNAEMRLVRHEKTNNPAFHANMVRYSGPDMKPGFFKDVDQGGIGHNSSEFMDLRPNYQRLFKSKGWNTWFSEIIRDPNSILDAAYYCLYHHDGGIIDMQRTQEIRKATSGIVYNKYEPHHMPIYASNQMTHYYQNGLVWVTDGDDYENVINTGDITLVTRHIIKYDGDGNINVWMITPARQWGFCLNSDYIGYWKNTLLAFHIGSLKFEEADNILKYKIISYRGGVAQMLIKQNCIIEKIIQNKHFMKGEINA